MSIPYYSMDLNKKELFSVLSSVVSTKALEGPAIKEYEQLICDSLGVKHAVTFPSGRTGFYYLINTVFKPGDEVIVSIYTFPFFIRLLDQMGIKPVFVDIGLNYALIDPELIEDKITEKTKGIIVTHLFGNACDMDSIVEISKRNNLFLIEDCAHAFGVTHKQRPVGGFGNAAVFSTSPMKVPTTLGGGFVVTNDEDVYKKISDSLYDNEKYKHSYKGLSKLFTFSLIYYLNSFPFVFSLLASRVFKNLQLKNPGELRKMFYSELISTKEFDPFERIRFSNMQAKVGISQIKRFDEMTSVRRKYTKIYESCFKDCEEISMIKEHPDSYNNYLYDIAVIKKGCDGFIEKAVKKGLFLMREDCWYCNSYDFSSKYVQDCAAGEKLKPLLVRLPNSSLLSEKDIYRVAEIIKEII